MTRKRPEATQPTPLELSILAEHEAVKRELNSVNSSLAFQLVKNYWKLREALLPPGTRRGQAYDALKRASINLLEQTRSEAGLEKVAHKATMNSGGLTAGIQGAEHLRRSLTGISRGLVEKRVLIIGELSMAACKTYRVDHKVAMFEELGYRTTVTSWTDFVAARHAMQTCALVIFYRVPAFEYVLWLIEEAERLDVPRYFDIDDLVFDVEAYQEVLATTNLGADHKKELLYGAGLYREALRRIGNGIASTPVIATAMKQVVGGRVLVVPNAIDPAIVAASNTHDQRKSVVRDPEQVLIGYGSGTDTHDADFELVAPALARLLATYPKVQLVLHGPLKTPTILERVKGQVFHVPFLARDDYYRAIGNWDVSIAPLTEQVFNDAKSNIKFLEASVMGVPSVCSPSLPFSEVIRHGENGFLAKSAEEWFLCLEQLVTSKTLRQRFAAEARANVLDSHALAAVAQNALAGALPLAEPKSAPLRVLVVNILFSPVSFGGATLVAEQLASELASRGCKVGVVTGLSIEGLPEYGAVRYEALGLPVFGIQLPHGHEARLDFLNPLMAEVFLEALEAFRPDVVHFHSIQRLGAGLLEACIQAKIPFVVTLHDAWWICQRQFMLNSKNAYCFQKAIDLKVCSSCVPDTAILFQRDHYLRGLLEQASLLLAPSAFQRDLYVANGFSPAKVRVNRNGVDVPERPLQRPPKQGPVRFAYLGGKAHHKGYFWLGDVFAKVSSTNFELHVVDIHRKFGESPISASDFSFADKVKIREPFEKDAINDFFVGIDVLLMPSLWKESFGLTVREALSRDVWVITADAGALGEDIVDGVNGNLVPMGDARAFAARVEEAIARFDGKTTFRNPYRDSIRGYPEQASELLAFLEEVAGKQTVDHKS